MTEQVEKYLYDILFAIESIEQFVGDVKKFEIYLNDYKTQSAVERQLGIIGEAITKVKKTTTEINISHAKDIVNLRNRLIHAYDNIDDSIIWAIIINHLPELKNEVNLLLKTNL